MLIIRNFCSSVNEKEILNVSTLSKSNVCTLFLKITIIPQASALLIQRDYFPVAQMGPNAFYLTVNCSFI